MFVVNDVGRGCAVPLHERVRQNAALIAESLVDVILRVPEEEQARLMAQHMSALGDLFLQKSGAEDGGSGSTH